MCVWRHLLEECHLFTYYSTRMRRNKPFKSYVSSTILLLMGWGFSKMRHISPRSTLPDLLSKSNSACRDEHEAVVMATHSPQSTDNVSSSNNRKTRPPILYGHLHIPKTAGTNINSMLAAKYERVCGHKGYSYDAFQESRRYHNGTTTSLLSNTTTTTLIDQSVVHDIYSNRSRGYHRGRVPARFMDEIGYENCDYVSQELSYQWWIPRFTDWPFPVELHLPCRDPIDHFMSLCNFHNVTIRCDGTIPVKQVVRSCVKQMNRFNRKLAQQFSVKCFESSPRGTDDYFALMDGLLQQKKIPAKFTRRETNKSRRKSEECIWTDKPLQEALRSRLMKANDYYSFCDQCMGSENDLFASK